MSVKIKCVTSQLPDFSRTTEEILPFLDIWLNGHEDRFIRKVKKIFENAAVDKRYSIMDPIAVFEKTSFEEKNDIYCKEVIKLGEKVLDKALKKAQWLPEELDFIITVSCTGFMIPSLDAYLINSFKLRQDIVRLPVTEMGCVAGISGIIYANNFLKANPGKKAAVVAVESPTATFQLDDFSMANIVSAAIFGDGSACVLLSSAEEEEGVAILDDEMYHFYDKTDIMGFKLTNSGLQMILDAEVPEIIASHFDAIIQPFLLKNNLKIADIDHLVFHPGGKKIIEIIEKLFSCYGKNIDDTKEVLRLYGNMSSVTVLSVLGRFMDKKPKKGTKGLMLSFGPGFSAQRVLLQF